MKPVRYVPEQHSSPASCKDRIRARELAEALKRLLAQAGPEADASPFALKAGERSKGADASAPPRHASSPAYALSFVLGFLAVTCGMHMASWVGRTVSEQFEEASAVAQAPDAGGRDAGSVAVGEAALTAPVSSLHAPAGMGAIGLDMPRKPFPGQLKPDASGKCPRPAHVPINGGCWLPLALDVAACKVDGYMHEGKCYAPVFPPVRQPTSGPSEHIDD